MASCVYVGEVIHQRFAPRRHRLRYKMFQMLFDLQELPKLSRRLRFFSHNRLNAMSFHDADHGDATPNGLRAHIEGALSKAGLSCEGGRVLLLCMPRIFGHVFNPLSIYYCFDPVGALIAMLYEVNNTFGERHIYIIPADEREGWVVRHSCDKEFYVSPFMDMDMRYDFSLSLPGETVVTTINGGDASGAPLISATFKGSRRDLSDASVLWALLAFPFMTLGVVGAIHWEALKLFGKGLRLRRRHPAGRAGMTVVAPSPRIPTPIG